MEATDRAPLLINRRPVPGAGAGACATLTLDFEKRQRSRFLSRLDDGREVAVRLSRHGALRTGDLLEIEGGELVRVVGADEELVEVRAGTPLLFARACYHMGNRHVPLQIEDGRFRFKPDHVLEAMLESLGATLTRVEAAFDPEPGAYEGSALAHGEDRSHAHSGSAPTGHDGAPTGGDDHAHAHSHAHSHADAQGDAHAHAHPHAQGDAHAHAHPHAQGDGHAHAHPQAQGDGHAHAHPQAQGGRARIHIMDEVDAV